VQNLMQEKADEVGILLKNPHTHIYLCGLRGMESGVDEAFSAICENSEIGWPALRDGMRAEGRYHIETY
jgi:benzoyl-CoA 2,3-dioxygenase component A